MPDARSTSGGAGPTIPAPPLFERLYTPKEVAAILRVTAPHARKLFADEEGVVNVGTGKLRVLRIPESALRRLYEDRANPDTLAEMKARRRRVTNLARFCPALRESCICYLKTGMFS